MSRCTPMFFRVDSRVLAPRLLGCNLVRILDDGTRLAGVIVEVEAYVGPEDLASHARGNRRTPRTEPMFARGGTSYVYFTYGMHFCMNIASGPAGVPQAVLLRALRPTEGLEAMRLLRAGGDAERVKTIRDVDLCRGPARLTQAMAIDRALNAIDMITSEQLWVEKPRRKPRLQIAQSPRIGVDSAREWKDAPLRWFVADSPFVSGPKRWTVSNVAPSARAPRETTGARRRLT